MTPDGAEHAGVANQVATQAMVEPLHEAPVQPPDATTQAAIAMASAAANLAAANATAATVANAHVDGPGADAPQPTPAPDAGPVAWHLGAPTTGQAGHSTPAGSNAAAAADAATPDTPPSDASTSDAATASAASAGSAARFTAAILTLADLLIDGPTSPSINDEDGGQPAPTPAPVEPEAASGAQAGQDHDALTVAPIRTVLDDLDSINDLRA